jgi:hypothetical protein
VFTGPCFDLMRVPIRASVAVGSTAIVLLEKPLVLGLEVLFEDHAADFPALFAERLLDRHGLGEGDDNGSASDAWADETPVLAGLAAASVSGTVALGPHRGARLRRLGEPSESAPHGAAGRAH